MFELNNPQPYIEIDKSTPPRNPISKEDKAIVIKDMCRIIAENRKLEEIEEEDKKPMSERAYWIKEFVKLTKESEPYIRNRINTRLYPCKETDVRDFFFICEKEAIRSNRTLLHVFNARTKI